LKPKSADSVTVHVSHFNCTLRLDYILLGCYYILCIIKKVIYFVAHVIVKNPGA
jgi:hypothetical protein